MESPRWLQESAVQPKTSTVSTRTYSTTLTPTNQSHRASFTHCQFPQHVPKWTCYRSVGLRREQCQLLQCLKRLRLNQSLVTHEVEFHRCSTWIVRHRGKGLAFCPKKAGRTECSLIFLTWCHRPNLAQLDCQHRQRCWLICPPANTWSSRTIRCCRHCVNKTCRSRLWSDSRAV